MNNYYMIATIRETFVKIVGYVLLDLEKHTTIKVDTNSIVESLRNNKISVENLKLAVIGVECTQGNIDRYSMLNTNGELVGFNIPVVIQSIGDEYIISDCWGNLKKIDITELQEINRKTGLANTKLVMRNNKCFASGINKPINKKGKVVKKKVGDVILEITEEIVKSINFKGRCIANNKRLSEYMLISRKLEDITKWQRDECQQCVLVTNGDRITINTATASIILKDFRVIYINKEFEFRTIEDIKSKEEKKYNRDITEIMYIILDKNNVMHIGIAVGNSIIDKVLELTKYTSILEYIKHFYKNNISEESKSKIKEIEQKLNLIDTDKINTKLQKANLDNIAYKLTGIYSQKLCIKEIYESNIVVLYNNTIKQIQTLDKVWVDNIEDGLYENVPIVKVKNDQGNLGIVKNAILIHGSWNGVGLNINSDKNEASISTGKKIYNIDYLGLNVYALTTKLQLDASARIDIDKELVIKQYKTDKEYIVYFNKYKFVYDLKKLEKLLEKHSNNGLNKLERKLSIFSGDGVDEKGLIVLNNSYYDILNIPEECNGINVDNSQHKENLEYKHLRDNIDKEVNKLGLYKYGGYHVYINNLTINSNKLTIRDNRSSSLICNNMKVSKRSVKTLTCAFKNSIICNLIIDEDLENIRDKIVMKLLNNTNNIGNIKINKKQTLAELQSRDLGSAKDTIDRLLKEMEKYKDKKEVCITIHRGVIEEHMCIDGSNRRTSYINSYTVNLMKRLMDFITDEEIIKKINICINFEKALNFEHHLRLINPRIDENCNVVIKTDYKGIKIDQTVNLTWPKTIKINTETLEVNIV